MGNVVRRILPIYTIISVQTHGGNDTDMGHETFSHPALYHGSELGASEHIQITDIHRGH
jgi:hypothetical protein